MSTYPKAFSYYLSRLNNFSRQKLRLQTLANTQFNPNDQIVIELQQGVYDLTTFTVQGFVNTNAGAGAGVYLPFAEGLIESVSIECGGVSIQNAFNNYGDLFNIFRQYQMEDKKRFRRVLQLEDQQTGAHGANGDAAMIAAGVTGDTPFAIYNWLGFLGSVKVLDTTLLPPVKIYIRLSPTAVLARHSGSVAVPTYRISDFRATMDVMSIDDGVYYNMVSQRLQSSPLEIPFENYTTVAGGLGAPTQSTRWSTSADCVEGIIATFKTANPGSFAPDAETGQSEYFTRTGQNVRDSVFRVNGVSYPTLPSENAIGDIFIDTAHTLGASQDTVGQTDPLMRTLTLWRDNFWVHARSFTYPDAEDSHRLCGLSGRGNQLLGSWDTNAVSGGPHNQVQPLLWLKHKSIMRIGANKMVEVVL
jgi:hypothetical protein